MTTIDRRADAFRKLLADCMQNKLENLMSDVAMNYEHDAKAFVVAQLGPDVASQMLDELPIRQRPNDTFETLELRVVENLVDRFLGQGFFVSVNDGERTVVVNARNTHDVVAHMRTTGEDLLVIRRCDNVNAVPVDRTFTKVGSIYLVYGNAPHEVVADYTTGRDLVFDGIMEAHAEWAEAQFED
jgi:hypothetical protein